MELIDKSVVLKEIERRAKFFLEQSKNRPGSDDISCSTALYGLLSFIDTLEVKEVDLEKEIQNYMTLHHLYIKDGGRVVFENNDSPNFMCDIRDIANHFFELGLKTQKGEKE